MKKIIILITALISTQIITHAQKADSVPVLLDAKTTYYMVIYDGVNNDKVVEFDQSLSWKHRLKAANFTGALTQLFKFDPADSVPGYLNINSASLGPNFYLKSFRWFSYMENQVGKREGNEEKDPELNYKFRNLFDDWYVLETIEKDSGLNKQPYTPGAQALNQKTETGYLDFTDLKSDSITPENAQYRVFKLVEFSAQDLFDNTLKNGQILHDTATGVTDQERADFFYKLEKARSIRLFGTPNEMIEHQAVLDAEIADFLTLVAIRNPLLNINFH